MPTGDVTPLLDWAEAYGADEMGIPAATVALERARVASTSYAPYLAQPEQARRAQAHARRRGDRLLHRRPRPRRVRPPVRRRTRAARSVGLDLDVQPHHQPPRRAVDRPAPARRHRHDTALCASTPTSCRCSWTTYPGAAQAALPHRAVVLGARRLPRADAAVDRAARRGVGHQRVQRRGDPPAHRQARRRRAAPGARCRGFVGAGSPRSPDDRRLHVPVRVRLPEHDPAQEPGRPDRSVQARVRARRGPAAPDQDDQRAAAPLAEEEVLLGSARPRGHPRWSTDRSPASSWTG